MFIHYSISAPIRSDKSSWAMTHSIFVSVNYFLSVLPDGEYFTMRLTTFPMTKRNTRTWFYTDSSTISNTIWRSFAMLEATILITAPSHKISFQDIHIIRVISKFKWLHTQPAMENCYVQVSFKYSLNSSQ